MEASGIPAPGPVQEAPAAATLAWVDAEKATIIRWMDGQAVFERLDSGVPSHHRSTGHQRRSPRHEAGVVTGGYGPGLRAGGYGHPAPSDETHRAEHLRQFVAQVASRLTGDEPLLIMGTGSLREHVERLVRDADDRLQGTRPIDCEASAPQTERQLVARLRQYAGDPPRRRTVGAYRWTSQPVERVSGALVEVPSRVVRKPPRERISVPDALIDLEELAGPGGVEAEQPSGDNPAEPS